MVTWALDGFAAGLFELSGSFMPPPPEGAQMPLDWGVEAHVMEMFAAAGARAEISRETVDFEWATTADAARQYLDKFPPIVTLRSVLEPQGRWTEYSEAFERLVERLDSGSGTARLRSEYLLTTVRV